MIQQSSLQFLPTSVPELATNFFQHTKMIPRSVDRRDDQAHQVHGLAVKTFKIDARRKFCHGPRHAVDSGDLRMRNGQTAADSGRAPGHKDRPVWSACHGLTLRGSRLGAVAHAADRLALRAHCSKLASRRGVEQSGSSPGS